MGFDIFVVVVVVLPLLLKMMVQHFHFRKTQDDVCKQICSKST